MARVCLALLLVAVTAHAEEEDRTDEVFLLQTRRTLQEELSSSKSGSKCKGMVDLVFVIDESGSTCGPAVESTPAWRVQYKSRGVVMTCEQVNKLPPSSYPEPDGKIAYGGSRTYKYLAERKFLQDLIGEFILGPEDMQVAVVGFSNNWMASSGYNGARVISPWSTSAGALNAALESTTGVGGTYPHLGMELASNLLKSGGRTGAVKFVVVLLDGKPSGGPWEDYAAGLRTEASVVAIGYSDGADVPTLSKVASAEDQVFSNFDLSATADILVQDEKFCEVVCEEATCEIFEDPHVYGFDDERRGPLGLVERHASRTRSASFDGFPIDVNAYGLGDFWLIRSKPMLIQGRFHFSKAFVPDQAAVGAVAISGPFVDNRVLLVGGLEDGRVLWDGRAVQLGNFTFNFPGGSLKLLHHQVNSDPLTHRLEANFSSGFRTTIDRFAQYLNVKLTTRPLSGGMDGECGNFNRRNEDDSEEAVAARMGSLKVAEGERLIPATF